ncbi:MAG TPA: hypothetical protein PK495_07540 [Bacteroidales bacterium]|nr:hypothetical protein [Bacteroidales bacterium]HQB20414.1 hypothetical protein [Bacteroidales bacterium]
MENKASEKVVDDASLWFDSRQMEIQDYEIPEDDDFLNISDLENEDLEKEEFEPEKPITKKDILQNLNRIELREPTARLIISLMDVVFPLLFFAFFKVDKNLCRLDKEEKQILLDAWCQYLATKEVEMSPGMVLLSSMLTIYTAKLGMAKLLTKKDNDDDEA